MTVLLTGATGFVGSALLKKLIADGQYVRLLSRHLVEGHDTIICDLARDRIADDALAGIDTVYHLAGFAHDMRDASKIEHLYQAVNVDATVRLAKLAASQGVKRFVFISSVKAGGSAIAGRCMSEEDQGEPEGVYGRSKRQAELKLLEIGARSDMHVSIIRPSLVYGPGVKGNLRMMLGGIDKGWFPPLPELGNRRSMIHVDDLVRAILLVGDDRRANGEIFIATDNQPYSSREIYVAMCHVLGKSAPSWSVPKQVFDIAALVSGKLRYKINKLLGDECYSSKKLRALGFDGGCSLLDMNESDF